MAKKKTKVADRQKTKQHTPTRRRSGGGDGGGSGGGAMGGLRGGFRSLVGRTKGGASRESGSNFWNVLTWLLLAAAVAILVGRYAC